MFWHHIVHWSASFPIAIFIGFEFVSYTYEEQEAVVPDPFFPGQQLQVIRLVKSTESEQTFDIAIIATGSGEQAAEFGVDYTTGARLSQENIVFYFENDTRVFQLVLREDDMPEGIETFQLISLQRGGGAPFNPSVNSTATVFILDNDGESMSTCLKK